MQKDRRASQLMEKISYFIVPAVITATVLYGLLKGIDVFGAFLRGAKEGMRTVVSILPTMIAMLTAIYMLRASGAITMAAHALSPLLSVFHIPEECATLMLLKPISGSGGLAIGAEIMKNSGPDSYTGRVAAVMLGSSETTFYTISLYSGSLGITDIRYAIRAAIIADLVAFISSAAAVSLLFY